MYLHLRFAARPRRSRIGGDTEPGDDPGEALRFR